MFAQIIDYAMPLMKAESALKNAYSHLLHNEFEKASVELINAIVETKMAINAVNHLKENNHAATLNHQGG